MAFRKIQEYISTGLGNAGTLLIPKLILPPLIEEAQKVMLPRELAAFIKSGFEGSSFNVNLETPSTNKINIVAEGTEFPMTAMEYTAVEFTPVKYGAAIRITREMMEDSQFELFQSNLRAVGRRMAEKETALILEQLDGANTTTSGGAAITLANINASMLAIEDQDYNPTDIIMGNEVVNDCRNMDIFIEYSKAGNTEMMSKGFVGNIYGLQVSRFSTNAAPTTTYSKYAYVLDRSQAFGIAIKRDITVENFELPTYDMSGACVSMRIAVKLLRSKAVAKITTS